MSIALPASEDELANKLAQLQENLEEVEVTDFAEFIRELLQVKKEIVTGLLEGEVVINLTPTFINHMINEAMEALSVFSPLDEDVRRHPTATVLDQHKLWLTDIVGHLDAIKSQLDGSEMELKKRIHKEEKKFVKLRDKAVELISYLENGLAPQAAMIQFDGKVEIETLAYLDMLRELAALRASNQVLGFILPEVFDHMYREQTYYLHKLGVNVDPKDAVSGFL